jgi:hypothetical protein
LPERRERGDAFAADDLAGLLDTGEARRRRREGRIERKDGSVSGSNKNIEGKSVSIADHDDMKWTSCCGVAKMVALLVGADIIMRFELRRFSLRQSQCASELISFHITPPKGASYINASERNAAHNASPYGTNGA